MTRAISIEAYRRHIDSGKALTQWVRIYRTLKHYGPKTRAELEQCTGFRISSVCGRVKELLDAGMLEELSRRECSVTGEQAHPVAVATRWPAMPREQAELRLAG